MMADGPPSNEYLASEARFALEGREKLNAAAMQRKLAETALALARALPVVDFLYDPELDGPPMSPEQIRAAASDARSFLELVADLLQAPGWVHSDFAFSVALKNKRGWRPPKMSLRGKRAYQVGGRIYELMAQQCIDTGRPAKQEAAVDATMKEFGLARSKVMQALKDYREEHSWMFPDLDTGAAVRRAHLTLACVAMERARIERDGPQEMQQSVEFQGPNSC